MSKIILISLIVLVLVSCSSGGPVDYEHSRQTAAVVATAESARATQQPASLATANWATAAPIMTAAAK